MRSLDPPGSADLSPSVQECLGTAAQTSVMLTEASGAEGPDLWRAGLPRTGSFEYWISAQALSEQYQEFPDIVGHTRLLVLTEFFSLTYLNM